MIEGWSGLPRWVRRFADAAATRNPHWFLHLAYGEEPRDAAIFHGLRHYDPNNVHVTFNGRPLIQDRSTFNGRPFIWGA